LGGIFDLFACNSTTKGAIVKWRPQPDSSRQIGPEPAFEGILIIVGSGIAGAEEVWADFFALGLWRCSGQPCNNQQRYGQIDITVGFSRSERSRNNPGRSSDCSESMFYGRGKWIRQRRLDQETVHMAPVFLHMSRKLLTVLLAE
jgi:hypothetical protein